LFLLEIARPFEDWMVLGRTGESVREIRFADLGLDPGKEYFVFEFWTRRLLGSFSGSFAPGPLDPVFGSQALAIRERQPRPQVVATSRHVTCGGVDLADVRWADGRLSGKSVVIAGDPYELFLIEPEGYRLDKFDCPGATVIEIKNEGLMVRVKLLFGASGTVDWSAGFGAVPGGGRATNPVKEQH
ncbi:MAG: hypothetical protein NT147_09750, partial [Candidatus Aminicenantes bacterium]|nr:hypothetical protein [Candidatus Aminicenantes bacterium]